MRDNERMTVKSGMESEYESYVAKNQDPYGNAIVVAGAAVGKALDEGKTPEEADKAMCKAVEGITGFMASGATWAVDHFHPRGEEFKKWWNAECGVVDSKGVVNAAVLVF